MFNRGLLCLVLAVFSFNFSASVASGEVVFLKEERNGVEYLVLMNEYIRVEVIPEASGRISGYIDVNHGFNHFLEYEETALSPLLALAGQIYHNDGGFCDQNWSAGMKGEERLKYEVLKADAFGITLARPDGMIVKHVALEDPAGTSVRVDVQVSNTHDSEYSYWAHGIVNVGGEFRMGEDYQILPVTPHIPNVARFGETFIAPRLRKFQKEAILHEKILPYGINYRSSDFFTPAQPWFAVADTHRNVILGIIVESADLIERGLMFYRCEFERPEGARMTQEIVFPPIAPRAKEKFVFRFVNLTGLEKVSYLNKEMGLFWENLDGSEENGMAFLHVSPVRELGECSIILELKSRSYTFMKTIQIPSLTPGEVFIEKIEMPDSLPPGEYKVEGRIITKTYNDSFSFIGKKVVIQ